MASFRHYEESSKKRHKPKRMLTRKPTTRPIDIFRLEMEAVLLAKMYSPLTTNEETYEKMTLEVGSCSVSSPQKTAGF